MEILMKPTTTLTGMAAVLLLSGMAWSLESTGSAAFAAGTTPSSPDQEAVNPDARVMAEFTKRLDGFLSLREKAKSGMPAQPKETTPEQIDAHQREFASRLAAARPDAKHGDMFTPAMQDVVRRLMAQMFADAKARQQLRDSLMDDNPGATVALVVNSRYPDEVPLSTMPPAVLRNLPRLPAEVEYRFVGEALILLDADAHIVIDFMPNALP